MSESDLIDVEALHLTAPEPPTHPTTTPPSTDLPASLDIDELETWAIRRALQQTSGNVSQAARLLGMSRDTLHTKLKKKAIDREALVQAANTGE